MFAFIGLLIGILLVPAVGGNGSPFILGAVVLVIIVALAIGMRTYILKQRKQLKASGDTEKSSQVGFVVDTFHDLVGKLKEKEKELEKLRAYAEEKAISMEAYNENVLQSVPSGVISIDNSMNIKSINQAAEYILGINAKDVINKEFNEVFKVPLTELVAGDRTVSRGEYQYLTGEGRHIWLGITTSELKNTTGEKIGLILVFTDLTDIKTLQTQVELKQRLSQLGEMSAGISHELRNSMSVISGYAKLLSKKVEESNKTTVEAIITEIGSMDRIISELLAFARPSVLHMEKVDLERLINETAKSVAGDKSSIKIKIDTANPLQIKADEVLLRQALSNIIANAVQAMPGGGNIGIVTTRMHNKVEIIIGDTGPGIPEDIKQKIFLPFYTTREEGIGLGLALVQKIIVSHDGSVEVESTKGEGTRFRITLPAVS